MTVRDEILSALGRVYFTASKSCGRPMVRIELSREAFESLERENARIAATTNPKLLCGLPLAVNRELPAGDWRFIGPSGAVVIAGTLGVSNT